MKALPVSLGASLLLHAGGFLLGGVFLVAPATYEVDPSYGGLGVSLVAAGPEAPHADLAPRDADREVLRPDGEEPRAALAAPTGPVSGDGSSPVPGTAPITLQSPGGSWTAGRPGSLGNVPPRYPELARRLGQEGRVVLTVAVDPAGRPATVAIATSSGFPLLDESALDAVRRWRFHPRRLAALSVASTVEIPIRFQLDQH